MEKLELKDIEVGGKRVLVRVDFNVPMKDGKITDETRITAALPTLLALINADAKIILVTHLGRPEVGSAADRETLSTEPIAVALSRKLGTRVAHVNDCIGESVQTAVASMRNGEVLLLENVRFYAEETANDPAFAAQLASLADVYVNDAFGTAHRAHASTEGVTHYLRPCAAGLLMAREIYYLSTTLEEPARSYVAILGGAKISDKITLIENLLGKVDKLLIGGGMAYTFLSAMDSVLATQSSKLRSLTWQNHWSKAKASRIPSYYRWTMSWVEPLTLKPNHRLWEKGISRMVGKGWISVQKPCRRLVNRLKLQKLWCGTDL